MTALFADTRVIADLVGVISGIREPAARCVEHLKLDFFLDRAHLAEPLFYAHRRIRFIRQPVAR